MNQNCSQDAARHSAHPFIRSYGQRSGRITAAQKKALHTFADIYTFDRGLLDEQIRALPWVLDIGFGNGQGLEAQALAQPQVNFIGIDIYAPGIGRLLHSIHHKKIPNIRIYRGDVRHLLASRTIPPESIFAVQIFFPDPWHKKRHHKRRLIQPHFIATIAEILAPRSRLYIASDWHDYVQHIMKTISASPLFQNTAGEGAYTKRPQWRPLTAFEERAQREGRTIFDLCFEKIA